MDLNSTLLSKTLVLIVPGEGKGLYPIARYRPLPLVSFGGGFRIIDFTLSNCWNSGIRRAFVLPGRQAASVGQYLDSLDWNGGLLSLFPDPGRRYKGTADAIFQNLGLLRLESPDYILVLLSSHIYEMDYAKLLEFHAGHGADLTIGMNGLHDIGVYVFSAHALRRTLLMNAVAEGPHDLEPSVVIRGAGERDVYTYDLMTHTGRSNIYWGRIDTIDSYYRTQLNFCGQRDAGVGVVSPFVAIASGARVQDSILLEGAQIGAGAHIRKAIIEEDVRVPDGAIVGFDAEEDRRRFLVSKGGVVVVEQENVSRAEDQTLDSTFVLRRSA